MPEAAPRTAGSRWASIDLYWLPLGAGGRFVRMNGRLYEAASARMDRRPKMDLYHSALEVALDSDRYVIEVAPVWSSGDPRRGVVAEGPVGARWAGLLRAFRYEIRCWPWGAIPDVAEAVDSPRRLSNSFEVAERSIRLISRAPTLVWGRDELEAGEMWNSNSVVSWLLLHCGADATAISLPPGGRAPGWQAGIEVASREMTSPSH